LKVSVLVASYNNADFLEECVRSIILSYSKELEIVIVDDLSTDNSWEILQQWKNDNRFVISRNETNKGVGFTKNKCLQLATGQICAFVDADDALTPNALDCLIQKYTENVKLVGVYSNIYHCDLDLKVINIGNQAKQINSGHFIFNEPGIVSHLFTFKREIVHSLDCTLQKAIDQDLYLRIDEMGPMLFVDKPLYYYRHHQNSISLNGIRTIDAQKWNVLVKWRAYKRRKKSELPNVNILFFFSAYASLYRKYALYYKGIGRPTHYLINYCLAFLCQPIFIVKQNLNG
jgi:glycosyltransferase involved in cell wall biosynthesis